MSATKSSEQADRPRTIRPKLSHSHTVDVVIVASPPGYVMRNFIMHARIAMLTALNIGRPKPVRRKHAKVYRLVT